MRFYHLQPSELEAIDDADKLSLLYHARRIAARERLEFHSTIGNLLASPDDQREFLTDLAQRAYADDPEQLAVALESITRDGGGFGGGDAGDAG